MFLSWSDFLVCHDKCNILYACYRIAAGEEIGELLADFRNKRALGLGSLFGDHQLQGIVSYFSLKKKNWNPQTIKKLISVGFVVNKIMKTLKGGVHISAHVHESKCFFLFLINFMALNVPLTCT